jgi:hypothetical protein
MGRFYRKFDAGRSPLLDVAVYTGILSKFAVSAVYSAVGRRLHRVGAPRRLSR